MYWHDFCHPSPVLLTLEPNRVKSTHGPVSLASLPRAIQVPDASNVAPRVYDLVGIIYGSGKHFISSFYHDMEQFSSTRSYGILPGFKGWLMYDDMKVPAKIIESGPQTVAPRGFSINLLFYAQKP